MPSRNRPRAPEDLREQRAAAGNGRARTGGGRAREGEHVAQMQRRRLLTATVELVYEHGARALTVATICERAGLSRRTFYDIFDEREECLLATFEDAVAQTMEVLACAAAGRESWREKVRAGLIALLSFLDREPGMGRLLVVDALGAGAQTLNARSSALAQIIAIVDEGRGETKADRGIPLLTAEGVVGAVFAVIHARMLAWPAPAMGGPSPGQPDARALVELAGPLTAMVVQPYLGTAAAQRELRQPTTVEQSVSPRLPADPFRDLPIRLTYRTARVLSSIAATPGASSKQVAVASGIGDDGQISRLLTRLQRHELIRDTGIGPAKGMARAWSLTERGEGVVQAVGQ